MTTGLPLELGGTWKATAADDGLRRSFPSDDLDDGAWADLPIPSHWRSNPAFAGHDGPLLLRRRFETDPAAGPGRRRWLVLDGVFYQGDVFLDGSYVGDTEGYFAPHAFEVTAALAEQREHLLAIEVTCARPRDRTAKRNITGSFQDGEGVDPEWNPGGIWRPVRIVETGPVRIARLHAVTTEATAQRAVVRLRAVLDAAEPGPVTLRAEVGKVEHESSHTLATGANTVTWTVTVDDPELWWPHSLGDQPLQDVRVEVATDAGPSDERRFRTGLRQVRMRNWQLAVNGERLFLKGACLGPARPDLANAAATDLEGDVRRAIGAGLDLVRLHAHISRPEFYDAADRLGLLVWQDFPLRRGHARGIRKQAVAQAAAAVDVLGHHPSVAIWCGHDEPLATPIEPGMVPTRKRLRRLVEQELPTWNKTFLDGSVKRALEKADGSRPVVAHSGVLPHPGSGGTDSHAYIGWHEGELDDLADFCARIPRLVRFVGEFGAQSVPDDADFCRPERWPDLDWAHLGRLGMQRDCFDRHAAPGDHPTFAGWQAATQAYQAELLRRHIETLRRLKYRPTGGFCLMALADPQPAVGFGILDSRREPKPAYAAVAAACAPVIVVADLPAASYRPGDEISLAVHVVSDLRHSITGAVVTARLRGPGVEREWRWAGDVSTDSVARIGTLQVMAPDVAGRITLDLSLDAPGVQATNRYTSEVNS